MENIFETIAKTAYSTKETLKNSYSLVQRCINENIEGVFVECGVAAGAQIAVMNLAQQELNEKRLIYGFDSFVGIPLASEMDDQQPGVGYFKEPLPFVQDKRTLLKSSGITVHSREDVQKNLLRYFDDLSNFILIKGWFQDTLPANKEKIEKIAILRLDGDLYESTLTCLNELFNKVVSGGFIIIDDWALAGCRKACDTFFRNYLQVGEIQKVPNSTPVWFIKK